MALPAHSEPWPLIQFRNHPWTSDQPVARPLPKHKINAYTHQTAMPSVGFEPTIPAFEQAKTVHALVRAATVIGSSLVIILKNLNLLINRQS
jgi:hypothetical protein